MDEIKKKSMRLIPLPSSIDANKNLSQNFLIDRDVADAIVNALDLKKDDIVLEAGPGTGAITMLIAPFCDKLYAVEKDKKLVAMLESSISQSEHGNISIIGGDMLKTDIEGIMHKHDRYKIVSNLPYNITTPAIMKFLGLKRSPDLMVLMMQKEVADRILINPGNKLYGVLSVLCTYKFDIIHITDVYPESFIPSPGVVSTVLKFVKKDNSHTSHELEKTFVSLVKTAFLHRRKKLSNSLASFVDIQSGREIIENILSDMNIRPDVRAEQLSVMQFMQLAVKIQDHTKR